MENLLKESSGLEFTFTDKPSPADREYIHTQIKTYNNEVSPHHRAARKPGAMQPLAIFIKDAHGQILGGLVGDTYWGWLEIDDFWIDASLRKRGYGQELLLAAETEAAMRGCTQATLQTFSFQARHFYEKYGYRVVGQLDDYPPGHAFYWMRKDFGQSEHISFKHVRTSEDVPAYLAQLNRHYPGRPAVIRHIETELAALPFEMPQVVEFCFGPGMLARHLLRRNEKIHYTGFDFLPAFVDFAGKQLLPFGARAGVIKADLNSDGWQEQLPDVVHAVISLQSLHDLGDEGSVARIYRIAKAVLAPGGLFLNADLIVPEGKPNPANPGKLSVARHLELLREYGFRRTACTLTVSGFACVVGFA